MKELWDIVLKERISGFEHRAPNRKIKKDMLTTPLQGQGQNQSSCLLKFNVIKLNNIDINPEF